MHRECAVSNYGFGEDEGEQIEPQGQEPQGPKWFRERMDKVSEQLKVLQERNAQLEQTQRQSQIAEALTAKGFSPQAAGLYTGTPDKLDDWLGTVGAALAKTDGSAVESGQSVENTQTVVTPESQAAQATFAAAGQDGAAALASDDQLAARIRTATNQEDLDAIMREAGSKYV